MEQTTVWYKHEIPFLKGKIIEDISGGMKEFPKDYLLHAGTAWLFSDPRYDQQMDYLFGRMSDRIWPIL